MARELSIKVQMLITKRIAVFHRYNNSLFKHFQIWRKQNVKANFKFLTKFCVMSNTIWFPNYQFCPFDWDVEIFKCFPVQRKKVKRYLVFLKKSEEQQTENTGPSPSIFLLLTFCSRYGHYRGFDRFSQFSKKYVSNIV